MCAFGLVVVYGRNRKIFDWSGVYRYVWYQLTLLVNTESTKNSIVSISVVSFSILSFSMMHFSMLSFPNLHLLIVKG